MNDRKSRARLRGLFLLVFFTAQLLLRAAELPVALLGPSAPVDGKAPVRVTVSVLNVSPSPVNWKFPDELVAALRVVDREIPVRLRRTAAGAAASIRPDGFAQAEYTLQLPAELTGDAVLVLERYPGTALRLQIQAPLMQPAIPAPVAASALEDSKPDWRTHAFDPIDYFKRHLFPHEPFYFVAGPDSPNAKFQFSFKYQLVDARSGLAKQAGFVTNMFFGFTQTSLWDWERESAPFEDSSYKPELMFQFNRLAQAGEADWFCFDLQTGVMHESNGRDGANSRSLNLAYLRPKLSFGQEGDWLLTLAPRAWFYVGDLEDNPDLERYRGYADVRATIGAPGGIELAALVRVGDEFDRGSLQLDLTFPLHQIRWVGFTWYLQAQYFTGYGESLLHYNERSEAFRIGFSLYR